MNTTRLSALTAQHRLTTPLQMIKDALFRYNWDLALTLADQHADEVSHTDMLVALASHVPGTWRVRATDSQIFTPQSPGWSVPTYLDEWVIGVLEAGAPLDTSLEGRVKRDDEKLSWEGPVHALAVAMGSVRMMRWLKENAPDGWDALPVKVNGQASTLLHLAVHLEQWPMAKMMVEHGFPGLLPDGQGRAAWEVMSPQPVAKQRLVLDALKLWPPNIDDLEAGWKRRGLAAGLNRQTDMLWRADMAKQLAQGGDFEIRAAIQRMLRITRQQYRSTIVPEDLLELFKSTPWEGRAKVHPVTVAPVKGQWSLNQAALFAASQAGVHGWRTSVPGGTRVRYENDEIKATERGIYAQHLEAWTHLAPSLSDADLDAEMFHRRLSDRKVPLTARGLTALAWLELDTRNGLGEHDAHPLDDLVASLPHPPITTALARSAVDALISSYAVSGGQRQTNLEKLFKAIVLNDDGKPNDREVEWRAAVKQAHTPQERLVMHSVLEGVAANTPLGEGVMSWICQIIRHHPQPAETLPAKVLRTLPSPWVTLAAEYPSFNHKQSYGDIADLLQQREVGLMSTLVAWGFVPTADELNAAVANFGEHAKGRVAALTRLSAERREFLTPSWDAEEKPSPGRDPRKRVRP